jgi:peptidoglycan/LPS O-acetylase OafA/YrhL
LAIEEQFYLLFPLILWVGWRLRLNLFAIVATIFATSFVFYIHNVDDQPIAAFFSPKSRFWELMVGAILAYAALHHPDRLQAVRNIGRRHRGDAGTGTAPGETAASLLGLALLAVVIGGLNLGRPFANLMGEGFAVLGSALLIFAGPTALVNRLLLSNGIAVFVGLISYPLYLWHWPLLSF